MDLEIDRTRLFEAIALLNPVADRRSSMDVLAHVQLVAGDDALTCSATDMMLALADPVPCKTSKPGGLTLDAKTLLNVLRTLPEGTIRITALENSYAQIKTGRSEFRIRGLDLGLFPDLPTPKDATFVKVGAADLERAIARVFFSVSSDESRVNLNGALFDSRADSTIFVSTDGHRLTRFEAKLALGIGTAVVPRKGLKEIRAVLSGASVDEVEVGRFMGHLFVRVGEVVLSVKLSDVTFPPWEQVMPKEFKSKASVDRAEFAAALRQAITIAPEKTSAVTMRIGEASIGLSAANPELGSIALDVPAERTKIEGEGEFVAGFNAAYLFETMTAIESERVDVRINEPLDPIAVAPSEPLEDGDFLAVVMPMRI